jgi:hypothetical protein
MLAACWTIIAAARSRATAPGPAAVVRLRPEAGAPCVEAADAEPGAASARRGVRPAFSWQASSKPIARALSCRVDQVMFALLGSRHCDSWLAFTYRLPRATSHDAPQWLRCVKTVRWRAIPIIHARLNCRRKRQKGHGRKHSQGPDHAEKTMHLRGGGPRPAPRAPPGGRRRGSHLRGELPRLRADRAGDPGGRQGRSQRQRGRPCRPGTK